ncbi:hypothetical protein D3C73_1444340 [compost metagenome]
MLGKPGEVLVYGLRGNVLRSTDGGATWAALDSGLHVSITAGVIDAQGNYRLFTQGARSLVSQGGGAHMRLVQLPAPVPVTGVTRATGGSLLLVGGRGVRTLTVE